MEQVTWDYFIPKQWNHNYLAMQMQDIFRTLTKLDHKQDIYLLMEILQYLGDQLNKRWWTPPLIILEILAMHEASRECVWLRSMIQHIKESCGLSSIKNNPTVLYEDNVACIAQIKGGYIKGDRTKHISPKFFYTHELQKDGEIDVQQIRFNDNLADLFTKALPSATFKKLVRQVGMRQLKDLQI